MKKLMVTLVLFCLLFTLCSCGGINGSEKTNDPNEGGNAADQKGEDVLTYCESEVDYNKFIRSQKLPESFVAYDKVSIIGDFDGWVDISAPGKDYSHYMYSFVDASGHELCLYVKHDLSKSAVDSENSVTKDPITAKVNSKDMRKVDGENSGYYRHEGFDYKYVYGKLSSIVWISEGVEYTLCGSMMLSDYPDNTSTFVGKLLDLQTSSGALNKYFNITTK